MSKIKIIWLKHATILRKQCAKEAQEEHTGAFKQSKKCQTRQEQEQCVEYICLQVNKGSNV